jgi:hypothetical protein
MTIIINGTTGISGVDGSASVPAFKGNDADTGIFYPTANQVAASAGGATVWNASSTFGFKNRLINGAMMIDQRNAGASISTTSGAQVYSLDRWGYQASQAAKFTIQQNAGSITPPVGFSNYMGFTVGASANVTVGAADYFMFNQYIEGFNVADLNWGSVNAAPVTISFLVYSSVTGTYGGAITNAANNRTYPFTYSIPVANTWTTISITVAGDTTGTWNTTGGSGIRIFWGLGVGSNFTATAGSWGGTSGIYGASGATNWIQTNGATFYITGVQLEKGSTATSFDYRSIGTELQLCQRYFEKQYELATPVGFDFANDQKSWFSGLNGSSSIRYSNSVPFKVSKRTSPTLAFWDYNGVSGNWMTGAAGQIETTTAVTGSIVNENAIGSVYFTTSYNWSYGFWTASAEL